MSFVKEENGQVYLYQKTVSGLPGLGALPVSNYAAVKLPDNPSLQRSRQPGTTF